VPYDRTYNQYEQKRIILVQMVTRMMRKDATCPCWQVFSSVGKELPIERGGVGRIFIPRLNSITDVAATGHAGDLSALTPLLGAALTAHVLFILAPHHVMGPSVELVNHVFSLCSTGWNLLSSTLDGSKSTSWYFFAQAW